MTIFAPHGDPHRGFANPWGRFDVRFRDLLRWRFERSTAKNPYRGTTGPPTPRTPNDGGALSQPAERTRFTWVGHSTFAIRAALAPAAGGVALTDPHFGPRALVPRRLSAPGIPLDSIPLAPLALVSHNHWDHLDAWTARRLPRDTTWFAPLGLGGWFRRRGLRVREFDWGDQATYGPFRVTCLPAQHWSRRFVRINRSLWCGWLLEIEGRRHYFAGDTGWFDGFAEIGERFGPIEVAMLPIGAYAPRWFMRYQHLDPAEAYRAFLALGARILLPMHWGCFNLTDEPPGLAPVDLERAILAERGAPDPRVRVLAVGETYELPRHAEPDPV